MYTYDSIIYFLLFLSPTISFAQDWKIFNDSSILFSAKYPADWVNKVKTDKRVFKDHFSLTAQQIIETLKFKP